jgi:hypothetical protein
MRYHEAFASREVPKNGGFFRDRRVKRCFSTVFSTGVEILGNKPKLAPAHHELASAADPRL